MHVDFVPRFHIDHQTSLLLCMLTILTFNALYKEQIIICFSFSRLDQVCNHFAAVLFNLEAVKNETQHQQLSSTSIPCKWNQPMQKENIAPMPLGDMFFEKSQYGKGYMHT